MPEEIEIDTDKLRETIDEEIEKRGAPLLRAISLTTAILAALAAVASLRAGATVNEALLLKTEATRLQALASDQWNYYQAKGIKGAIAGSTAAAWTIAGRAVPPALASEVSRYAVDQAAIKLEAKRFEDERDTKSAEADALLTQHHYFAVAVALFQIAIALGAVAALTRVRMVWIASLIAGLGGLAAGAWPYLHSH
jgi:type II secretory pathway pseudopilin PulG